MTPNSLLRSWQRSKEGAGLLDLEMMQTQSLLSKNRPKLIVQLEGVSLLERFPDYGFYYHVSMDAEAVSPGYSVEARADLLPFADKSVDLLVLGHCFELVKDLPSVMEEIDRVMSPMGMIVIHAWVGHWLGERVTRLFHPIPELDLNYIAMRDIHMACERYQWGIYDKQSWSLLPNQLSVMQTVRNQVVQPMTIVCEKYEPSWADTGGAIFGSK